MSKVWTNILNLLLRWFEEGQELKNAEADRAAWLEQYIKPMPDDEP